MNDEREKKLKLSQFGSAAIKCAKNDERVSHECGHQSLSFFGDILLYTISTYMNKNNCKNLEWGYKFKLIKRIYNEWWERKKIEAFPIW